MSGRAQRLEIHRARIRGAGGGGPRNLAVGNLLELARHCGSTALALSMHTHLLAATVWRWRQEQPVEPLLRRIAEEQIVLVSTGASGWLDSSGTPVKADGGYRVTGRKILAVALPPARCWSPARCTTIPRTGRPCSTSQYPSPPKARR